MKTIAKIIGVLIGAIIFTQICVTPAYAATKPHTKAKVTTHTTAKPVQHNPKFGTAYGYQPYVIIGQTIYNPKKNYFAFIR